MADDSGVLKNTDREPGDDLYARVQRTNINAPQQPVARAQQLAFTGYPMNLSSAPTATNKAELTNMVSTASLGFTNPYHDDVRQSLPTAIANHRAPVQIVEQETKPYWESGEDSHDDWGRDASGVDYSAGEHASEEYDNYEAPVKKKGLSFKIDRFVQRFPVLGVLYKQPPGKRPPLQRSQSNIEPPTAYDFTHSHQEERELTADELAFKERYADKSRMRSIPLPESGQTQPVDVRVHQESKSIYLCDVGRSLVEIYRMDGQLERTINDAVMTASQPTALAVAFDGTMIIASYFNHCLQMYTPNDSQEKSGVETKPYKQYKLGAPGAQLDQFYNPSGIVMDAADGCLYVCDRGNSRIKVLRPDGICDRVIQLALKGQKRAFLDPVRIALQSGHEQIVCIIGAGDALCFLSKYAQGRTYVDPYYIVDEHGLGIHGASGLAVDAHDQIFISDTNHDRIVMCASDAAYIGSFGTTGHGPDQLKRPCGLDITQDGTLIVADAGNKRLQIFGDISEPAPVYKEPSVNEQDTPRQAEHDLFVTL